MHVLERSPKSSTATAPSLERHHKTRLNRAHSQDKQSDAIKEVQDLKEQLEALRCQVSEYLSPDCYLETDGVA